MSVTSGNDYQSASDFYPEDGVYRCNTGCISRHEAIYQTQKIIQNVVRVPSSLYSMNLASLHVYQPSTTVNWNQMSDRVSPAVQKGRMSLKSSKSSRPGGLTPGGAGCDIKHNSYERYLARIKGRTSARKGVPLVNSGFAEKGGKTTKLNIVTGCDCVNSN